MQVPFEGQSKTPQTQYLVLSSAVDPLPPFTPQHVRCTTTDMQATVVLPKQLDSVVKASQFPNERHRWNTNEEVAAILIAFEHHLQWQAAEVRLRPLSGSMLLYNRKKARYRKDGYVWKKRKDGKTTREDHMKLKVQGVECIYGCYVHSAILPTFHRRCYWLLQNPDIVLVHYLNVPLVEDSKGSMLPPSLLSLSSSPMINTDGHSWSANELLSQLKPMLSCQSASGSVMDPVTNEMLQSIVKQMAGSASSSTCVCSESVCTGLCRKNRAISPRTEQPKVLQILNQGNKCALAPVTSAQPQPPPPLILNLSQLHSNKGLIILSSQTPLPVIQQQQQQPIIKEGSNTKDHSTFDDLSHAASVASHDVQKLTLSDAPSTTPFSSYTTDAQPPSTTQPETSSTPLNPNTDPAPLTSHSSDIDLDAFNILDLPDFESFSSQLDIPAIDPIDSNANTPVDVNPKSSFSTNEPRAGIANITDFSPEWAYQQGGAKILVTGPWYSTTSPYSVLFDGVSVPAALVQSGVLRCFCPSHDPGLVSIQVACEGFVISDSCVFEYKTQEVSVIDKQNEWFGLSVEDLQLQLIERFEEIEKRLTPVSITPSAQVNLRGCTNLEARLQESIDHWNLCAWRHDANLIPGTLPRKLTLLHLVSALGFTKLVTKLSAWKAQSLSLILQAEMDPMALDDRSCTPLMWSCARGHFEMSVILYQMNNACLSVCNQHGFLPISLCRLQGHSNLADVLEKLESARREMSILKSEVKEEEPKPQKPIQMTLVKTSTGMMLTPVFSEEQKLCIPVRIQNDPVAMEIQKKDESAERRQRLLKRTSVEVLPDYPNPRLPQDFQRDDSCPPLAIRTSSPISQVDCSLRPSTSDSDLPALTAADPMISMSDRDLNSPIMFMQTEHMTLEPNDQVAMETDSHRSDSPLVDVDGISPIDVYFKDDSSEQVHQEQMITLADQIIAAMPDRIKASPGPSDDLETEEMMPTHAGRDRSASYSSFSSCSTTPPEDSGISTPLDGMSFDEYRYTDLGTPASSLSPASSCLHSPYNFNIDSPPPTAADFLEYFNAPTFYMEKDFSQLTLSDEEQRHLYHAAKIIQHFYRRYKDKKEQQQKQRQRQMEAAILIQSYYRRYKQYMYFKKMTQAAVLIQSQFRTYYAQKRFRKSREAATIIQNRYRAYKEHERYKKSRSAAVIIQQRFRSHYQRKRIEQGMANKVTEMMEDSSLSSETDVTPVTGVSTSSKPRTKKPAESCSCKKS